MHIWKTAALARAIKGDAINAKQWKQYYLAMSILMTLLIYSSLALANPVMNPTALLVELIAMLGVLIFGISITYNSNKGDKGQDYIARMTALSLPITIKLFVLSVCVVLVLALVEGLTGRSDLTGDYALAALEVLSQILFFWRLNIHIKFIND